MKDYRTTWIAMAVLFVMLPLRGADDIKWGTRFNEYYQCEALGTKVGFQVQLPPKVEDADSYPMIVVLKGGARVAPGEKFPFIQVKPSGGGIWGYRAMSTYDAKKVIAHMKKNYPVDPDRIYLVGFSAGASGAMHLASICPDQFAAVVPMVAMGNNYFLKISPISRWRFTMAIATGPLASAMHESRFKR